jgi:hypothetical protein
MPQVHKGAVPFFFKLFYPKFMKPAWSLLSVLAILSFMISPGTAAPAIGGPKLEPNTILHFQFPELPATFLAKKSDNKTPAQISAQLPANYTAAGKYPLFVFLEGGLGSAGDDLVKNRAIIGDQDFISVSLPLFKTGDTSGGLPFVNLDDYVEIGPAYTKMLQKLLDTVPNVDTSKSAMCGFSNGGHTIADILIKQEPFFMKTFHSFALVEGGTPLALHMDIFTTPAFKNIRFLILVGDHPDAQAAIDMFTAVLKASGANASVLTMPGVGHDFPEKYYPTVRSWVKGDKPILP